MKYRYVSDSHVHTRCSSDAVDTSFAVCESAVERGIFALTITDHCECNAFRRGGYDRSVPLSCAETEKAAAAFAGRLRVLCGIELGEPLQELSAAEQALGCGQFDFVLASVHNVRGKEDFYSLNYADEDVDDLLARYFGELLETVEWGRFDSLAHLTYPLRYMAGKSHIPINMGKWSGSVDGILKALIRKQKALEVNTSGLRQEIGATLPDLPILRRYRELGGELVTLGSDAHRREDVGAGIEAGLDVLRKAGFQNFAVYVAHEPKIYPIEPVLNSVS